MVAVQAQVLQAIVSANLSFWKMGNPEMLKLFGMLWIAAPRIIPSRKVIGGQLLDKAFGIVDSMLGRILTGKNLGLLQDCNDTRTICSADFGIVGLMDGNLSQKMPWMAFVQMWISRYVPWHLLFVMYLPHHLVIYTRVNSCNCKWQGWTCAVSAIWRDYQLDRAKVWLHCYLLHERCR